MIQNSFRVYFLMFMFTAGTYGEEHHLTLKLLAPKKEAETMHAENKETCAQSASQFLKQHLLFHILCLLERISIITSISTKF